MIRIKTDTEKQMFGETFKVKMIDANEIMQLKAAATQQVMPVAEVKEAEGYLAGYFSTFNNADAVGDVIRAGAFTKTLKERTPKALWYHDPRKPIGKVVDAWEDSKGLFGVIKLNLETQLGKETYEMFKAGDIDSFSIGFMLEKYEVKNDGAYTSYDIKEVRLLEVSAVTFPANEQAVVTAVKNHVSEIEEINKTITETVQHANSIEELITVLTLVKASQAERDDPVKFILDALNEKDRALGDTLDQLFSTEQAVTKDSEPDVHSAETQLINLLKDI